MSDADRPRFWEACGGRGPLRLLVKQGGGQAEPREFDLPFVVAGRATRADLKLPNLGRRELYLQAIGGRLFFLALGAGEVRWLGQGRPDGPIRWGWLTPDEAIQVGETTIQGDWGFAEGEPCNPMEPGPIEEEGMLPEFDLEIPRRGGVRLSWRMDRVLALVGHSPLCRVRLAQDTVSSVQCALLRTPGGLWMVDLLGRGGVAVDGRLARFARLQRGDVLEVGRYRIRPEPVGTTNRGAAGLPALIPPPSPTELLNRPGPWGGSAFADGTPAWPAAVSGGLPADLGRAMLGQLAGQFEQMQQQMFSQFQQTMLAMAEMFGRLHQEQVETMRAELERIGRLNQELTSLQAEMATRSAGSVPAGGVEPTPPPDPRDEARPISQAAPVVPSASEAAAAVEMHEALNRRIRSLQEERQGRWQRLVELVIPRG